MGEAAALPVAVVTARAALDAGAVGPGSRILIHAAAGGVGSIAVQMAKLRGAEVTALASGGHIAFVKDLGADHVVDRTTPYRSEEHTSELQSLMRISYAVFCLKKNKIYQTKLQ